MENAKRDLEYEPVRKFEESWPDTIEWFKTNWLPGYLERNGGVPPPPAAVELPKTESEKKIE